MSALKKKIENTTAGKFRIGTSGIVVPGTKQTYPIEFQDKSRLNYYASIFNSLEVNSTFHKLPMASTLAKWSLDVPEDFKFTLKLWREITHIKNLQADLDNIDLFFSLAENIGKKKGCLLIQFPGKITMDYFNQVEAILERLHQLDPNNTWRKAVEFRSPTWYVSEAFELLEEYDASLVMHDMPKSYNLETSNSKFKIQNAKRNSVSKLVYLRYHGPTGNYRESYSNEFLQEQATNILNYLQQGKDVYAYFNNTMGSALENVLLLKSLVEGGI